MSFVLKLRDVIVGRSDLATRDPERGTARGSFRPGLGWELVEPIFALLPVGDQEASDEQRARYRKARDTLALALYDSDGALVETSRIDILPDAASSTGLSLAVQVVDDAFFSRGPTGA
ncbi:MAG: hypothetical protein U0164_03310 [Gemmatimonadaceae bacterium]